MSTKPLPVTLQDENLLSTQQEGWRHPGRGHDGEWSRVTAQEQLARRAQGPRSQALPARGQLLQAQRKGLAQGPSSCGACIRFYGPLNFDV